VLVAAAVDYEMIRGKRHGDIAELVADDVKARRRRALGIDPEPQSAVPLPVKFSEEEKRRRELAGGIVLVGRGTFKEFMAGLKRGWTEPLDKIDKDAALAGELALDGAFDEPEVEGPASALDGEPLPTPSRFNPSASNTPVPIFSPLQAQMRAMEPRPAAPPPAAPAVPAHLNAPPAHIPQLPPLLLVAHTNFIGLSQIPRMLWDFFNERHHARAGAAAGYALVMAHTRPFAAPRAPSSSSSSATHLADPAAERPADGSPVSDLDFGRDSEAFYKRSLNKWPAEVESARKEYYAELPKRLDVARALARRTREPTSDESKYPPPTEVELREERMKKEKRWRSDMRGWGIIKPDSEVEWDERFEEALSVFVEPKEEATTEWNDAV
jgi:import inner membrane translocase subunit TIM54